MSIDQKSQGVSVRECMAVGCGALRLGVVVLVVAAAVCGFLDRARAVDVDAAGTAVPAASAEKQVPPTAQVATPASDTAAADSSVENSDDDRFMRRAIELSRQAYKQGGPPFGAVVVQNGRIVGEGMSSVVREHDPTAHAEILAIRQACRTLGVSTLEGCEVYSSAEPCPMCLAAIYWSRVARVYYGNTIDDTARLGFADKSIYGELATPIDRRTIPEVKLLPDEAIKVFQQYDAEVNHEKY